ncbi:class I SAM-dependent methyltransferase [Leptolyngbya sp. NK1-12]|uniref:Class I SAM-dependent methyltransferase n=1 Tax=Leptolyngbya sp. NK1-12 TaxID=2547451 RepID=A0AA96WL94_9CYAN|nr:class I SAM-dependent methyltransferase [Leptolyngbya sp. NK1-12]WNZ27683.1 class I SAM-dependent methyltransferase [Leptolyngbya sp. NK1-12]
MKTYEELNLAQTESETDSFTLDRYRQFFQHFPRGVETVLDVGCNTGRGGQILKALQPSLKIAGLDCVESRLKRIPKSIYDRAICSYSTSINSQDAEFDVVVAGEFIEHLYPDDVTQTLKEFYRILKPNARLLLTTPNPDYLRLKLTGGSVLGGAHVSQHFIGNLRQLLESCGFVNIRILGSGKVSRLLGERCPVLAFYGSYLAIADKASQS